MLPESRQLHRVGKSSGHSPSPSFDVIVVISIPIVARIREIGRAHVWTPVTWNAIVCRLLLDKKYVHWCFRWSWLNVNSKCRIYKLKGMIVERYWEKSILRSPRELTPMLARYCCNKLPFCSCYNNNVLDMGALEQKYPNDRCRKMRKRHREHKNWHLMQCYAVLYNVA